MTVQSEKLALENVALAAVKEGKRRAHWPMVAAACQILSESDRPDTAYWDKEKKKYDSRTQYTAEARVELEERARKLWEAL